MHFGVKLCDFVTIMEFLLIMCDLVRFWVNCAKSHHCTRSDHTLQMVKPKYD